MNQLHDFAQQHIVAAMAAVHFAHLAWGKIKAAWPGVKAAYIYARSNGGAEGILKEFLQGKPPVLANPPHNPT